MKHATRLRNLEATVSPPLAIGSLLDEPCGYCGSSPVRLDILLLDRVTREPYPPPVGMVGCAVCHHRSFSEATVELGATEGWFQPGGWVYELYAKYPRTDAARERHAQTCREARAVAATARGEA